MQVNVPGAGTQAVAPTVFLRVPLTRQSTCFSCGCAALQSVLGWYGHDLGEGALIDALGATYEHGTRYPRMLRYANELGVETVERMGMSLDGLRDCLRRGNPVLLALQAWASDTIDTSMDTRTPAAGDVFPPGGGQAKVEYAERWEDGHYVVAVGFDDARVFFMDPSTLGQYTYLPNDVLLARWHDYYNPRDNDPERIDLHQWGVEFVAPARFAPDTLQYLG